MKTRKLLSYDFGNLRDRKCILEKIQARSFKIENQICQWNFQWVSENYFGPDVFTDFECPILKLKNEFLIYKKKELSFETNFKNNFDR